MSNRQNVDRQNAEQTKCRQAKCRIDKMSTDKMHVTPCLQNSEETIVKYAVDANLLRLGSTDPKKNIQLDTIFSIVEKKWLDSGHVTV